mmetsp:Transcript_298/g.670  ORF Transcript_298/g.670 Transcript_298/m.670 type:complete len:710 (-) Transcript_298:2997-5126(-)
MQNVLPTFKTFHLDNDSKKQQEKSRRWEPSSSLPRINKTPTFLKDNFQSKSRPLPATSYHISNSAAPNKRYLNVTHLDEKAAEVSPLCETERGERVRAYMKQSPATGTRMRRDSGKHRPSPQVVHVHNGGGIDTVQVFFAGAAIRSLDVHAGQSLSRIINGNKVSTDEATSSSLSKVMDFYLSTTRRLATVMSLRQEICEFKFAPGPLGIEVQLRNGKLCCASVSPGSQAEAYCNIKDSEPLSINGIRVVTLRGFEEALYAAQCCAPGEEITIQAIAIKQEKLPYEDMIGVTLKNKKVSNLFKNVLNKGKGTKRGGRFQNMTLEDSDDDDDEPDVAEPKQTVLDQDSSKELSEKDNEVDDKTDEKDVLRDTGSDDIQHKEESSSAEGAWTFVSESKAVDDQTTAQMKAVKQVTDDDVEDNVKGNNNDSDGDGEDDEDEDDFDESEEGSVNAALLADPNRHRNTASILNSIALGIDPVITPLPSQDDETASPQKELLSIPKEEEETKVGAAEKVEDEEDQGLTCVGWDYATALESGDMTAHLKLIGVPPSICSSQNGWGRPSQSRFMNFMNISSKWDIELFWVGEDSALISRSILEMNENHVELLSPDHVWCLTARRHDVEELECSETANDDDVEVSGESSVSILFRPPKKSPENIIKHCVRIMWIPWVSLSFAETSTQLGRNDTNEYPDVDFKIFDRFPSGEEEKNRRV